MTRLSDEDLNKLERALAESHRSRQEPSLGAAATSGPGGRPPARRYAF